MLIRASRANYLLLKISLFFSRNNLRNMPALENVGVSRDKLQKIWFTCSLTIFILVMYRTIRIFHNSDVWNM